VEEEEMEVRTIYLYLLPLRGIILKALVTCRELEEEFHHHLLEALDTCQHPHHFLLITCMQQLLLFGVHCPLHLHLMAVMVYLLSLLQTPFI
jgi:hypothetical protein